MAKTACNVCCIRLHPWGWQAFSATGEARRRRPQGMVGRHAGTRFALLGRGCYRSRRTRRSVSASGPACRAARRWTQPRRGTIAVRPRGVTRRMTACLSFCRARQTEGRVASTMPAASSTATELISAGSSVRRGRVVPDVCLRGERDRKTLVQKPEKKGERHAMLLAMSTAQVGPARQRTGIHSGALAKEGTWQARACSSNWEQRSH
jgi:hypothetical protein